MADLKVIGGTANSQDLNDNFSNLDAQLADIVSQYANKKIKVVAGALRNDGSGWQIINDSLHDPVNIDSVTIDGFNIVITYGFTAIKVLSLVASPDERFAEEGYFIGSSVGTSDAKIRISQDTKSVGGYVYYDGSAWQVVSSRGNVTINSFSSGGQLVLNHDDVGTSYALGDVSTREDGYRTSLGAMFDNETRIQFYDNAGNQVLTPDTNMKFYFNRYKQTPVKLLDPTKVVNSLGNIWVFGIMEVS